MQRKAVSTESDQNVGVIFSQSVNKITVNQSSQSTEFISELWCTMDCVVNGDLMKRFSQSVGSMCINYME